MKVEFVKPDYVYLKIIPATSIRNSDTYKIAQAIQSIYKPFFSRFTFTDYKEILNTALPQIIRFEVPCKVSYMIYITKKTVEFYFIVDEKYKKNIKEALSRAWNSVTIFDINKLPTFSSNAMYKQLVYAKEDALSLSVDRRDNDLITNNLNIIDILQHDDKVGIFYNFIPTSQYSWRASFKNTLDNYNRGNPVDKNKFNAAYIFKSIFYEMYNTVNMFNDSKVVNILSNKELSKITKNKGCELILNSQIALIGDSPNKLNTINNLRSLTNSFRSIDEDNYLKYKSTKRFNYTDLNIGTELNKCSVKECTNFISLPGRELLEKFNFIEKIDTFESQVPEELQKGAMFLGNNTFKGKLTQAYLTSDPELKNLTLTIIGPTRAGKTKLIGNLSRNGIDNNECIILFDFCGNAELSSEVASVINSKKVLDIDCSDISTLQGLGYNEVEPLIKNDFELYRCAKTKTNQLTTLINSINTDDGELRARMERYLEASSLIVFIQNGPIKDVFSVLQDYKIRERYLNNIPDNQINNLEEYILALEELDEWSKETKDNPKEIIGTKLSFVQGILNRVSKLKKNTYMELMLKKDCTNNISLINEMQKSQLICIKMPEIMFSTEQEKDIYATYWLTKIWGALQKRKWDFPDDKDRVKVNIVFDELYQVPNCQEFLRSKLSQIAKFSCKPIISCHYLGQIGIIRDELKAANSSYMMIAGCDKDNYKELKDELYPYELQDLLNLKRYHSLNLIKYEQGWAKFITELPKPI